MCLFQQPAKEELQSVNEELITVNAELQSKIEQFFMMQKDMKNLIDNINGGTIFLDGHLKIKRFTREAAQIFRLVATDLGRPLCAIKSNIQDENLLAEAQAVLDSLTPQEHEVGIVGGAWYLVRIQPYRTLENVIDGVVWKISCRTIRASKAMKWNKTFPLLAIAVYCSTVVALSIILTTPR